MSARNFRTRSSLSFIFMSKSFFILANFFQIESNAELGKYLVASRDLKEGEVLFSEPPLVVGPVGVTLPVCLACYNIVGDDYK